MGVFYPGIGCEVGASYPLPIRRHKVRQCSPPMNTGKAGKNARPMSISTGSEAAAKGDRLCTSTYYFEWKDKEGRKF